MAEWKDFPRRMADKRTWWNSLLGIVMPDTMAPRDRTPAPLPARVVPGGAAAPELCMLARDTVYNIADLAREEQDMRRRDVRLVQLKVDGLNACWLDKRIVGGREGMPLDCALHCYGGLSRLEQAMGEPMAFFGEYSADAGFNATLREHRRGQGEGTFWLYDAVPYAAWLTGRPYTVPIEQRLARLGEAFKAAETGLFVGMLAPQFLDLGQTWHFARELWAAGYEGCMSKRLGSPFVRGRSDDWFKVKERFRAVGQIVDTAVKDGRLARVILRVPGMGIKPITISRGWSKANEEKMLSAERSGQASAVIAQISFELTVGETRTVRSAKWEGLL